MAKSFYIERTRFRRLWSLRTVPKLITILGAIGWKTLWRFIERAGDILFLGEVVKWLLSGSKMSTLLQSHGWVLLVAAFLWLIFRASRKPPKQQYDISGWDALQFILNDTVFGQGKTEDFVEKYLKLAVEKRLIRVWAQPPSTSRYDQISAEKMLKMRFDLEPGGSGGKICDEIGGVPQGDYYYSPKFSIEELNAVFKSKGLLTRVAEWWLKRKRQNADKIEGMLRD